MLTHEEAKSIVGDWLEHRWIETDMEPYDLTPILAEIERVEAHLNAEYRRIEKIAAGRLAVLQAAADLLPRGRYRMVYEPDNGRFMHRVPIDCWSGRTYGDGPAGLFLHPDYDTHVRHGDILEVVSRQDGHECIREAIIECTDEWIEAHSGVTEFRAFSYHPTPDYVTFAPLTTDAS